MKTSKLKVSLDVFYKSRNGIIDVLGKIPEYLREQLLYDFCYIQKKRATSYVIPINIRVSHTNNVHKKQR